MRPYTPPRPRQRILGLTDSRAPIRLRAHGLTPAEQDALRAAQRGLCAICARPSAHLQVDHDHRHCAGPEGCRTCVRGLLCPRCNTHLGGLRDVNIPRLFAYPGAAMSLAADFRAALDPAVLFERAFGLVPLPWQAAYLREDRPTAVLKGRQVGASLAAAALAIHATTYVPAVNAVIVSPSLKQSTEITTRARLGLRNLGVRLVQDSTSMLRLANGSRILSLPGTARSVRGWTAKLLLLDEAAFVEPATFVAARALVATGGRLVVQSTPAIEAGDFYELIEAADPDWARFTVRSDEVPTISADFLAAERRAMSPDAYSTEYECVFGKVGATLFSLDQIAGLILPEEET